MNVPFGQSAQASETDAPDSGLYLPEGQAVMFQDPSHQ
jgi:hypothetical protein